MSSVRKPENSLIQDVTGIILAGGKSRRFGKNKAFIPIDGVPLIERVVSVMASVFEHRLLITNTPEEYGYLGLPMVEDLIKGLGPLGGIYTGLETIPHDAAFFVACDMPCLNGQLMRHMVGLRTGYDAVVPRIDRMFEPLYALYARTMLGPLKGAVESGLRQILDLFSRIRVRYVEEDVIRGFDRDLRCFVNVNRPEDLAGIAGEQGRSLSEWPGKKL